MKMEEIYEKMIEQNGLPNQLVVAVEEYAELIKEVTKFLRGKGNKLKLIEELADVEVVNDQVMMGVGITKKQVKMFKDFKLKRLEEFYLKEKET